MKRIYYLLAIAAVTSFSACNPLDKTYKQLGDLPAPKAPAASVTITLSAADYALLPKGNSAQKSLYFKTVDSAKAGIPLILAAKYPTYGEKSSATVTYASAPLSIKPVDSIFNEVAYTLKPADYTLNGGTNTYTNFSATQIITWLGITYPAAVENQLAVITFNFYEGGATTTGVQQSFLFKGGAWTKLYTISPAQYTSVGKGGNNNDFVSADAALLPNYFNAFLKVDPAVSATAKAGDTKYVSYKYYAGGAAPNTFQRVMVLTFDGANWTTTSTPGTIVFAKTNGIWVADNTVTLKLATADYKFIAAIPGIASDAAMANLNSFGNFNIQGGTTSWTDDQINDGIIALLKSKYPAAETDQKFVITYAAYSGANILVTKTFVYNGTTFVLQQ